MVVHNLAATSHAWSLEARSSAMSHMAWMASCCSALMSPRSIRERMFCIMVGRGRPFTKTLHVLATCALVKGAQEVQVSCSCPEALQRHLDIHTQASVLETCK
jgi:hypothetical protein